MLMIRLPLPCHCVNATIHWSEVRCGSLRPLLDGRTFVQQQQQAGRSTTVGSVYSYAAAAIYLRPFNDRCSCHEGRIRLLAFIAFLVRMPATSSKVNFTFVRLIDRVLGRRHCDPVKEAAEVGRFRNFFCGHFLSRHHKYFSATSLLFVGYFFKVLSFSRSSGGRICV